MKGFVVIGAIIVLAIIGVLVGVPFLDKAICIAKTESIGMNSKWSFLGGCKVEHKPGLWIPLERYRIVEGSK